MDEERLKKAIELAKIATDKDTAHEYEEAFHYYKSSLDHWQFICKYQTNPVLKTKLYEKMEPYINRAEAIKKYLDEKKNMKVSSAPIPTSEMKSGDVALNTAFDHLLDQKKTEVKWNDVAGLEAAKSSLQEAVILPIKFPDLFRGKRQPWKGILLYGPPGTGKTYLAKACATETSSTFLSISSADIISKWQGESEKLVRALFQMASEKAPTIIFIDEVDSLCGARNDRESESSKRVKTEFLVQMEGLSQTSENRILVLGATNEPWILDAAIRRRFERRIYIPLPDNRARVQLLRVHMGDTPNNLTDKNLEDIAEKLDGYSGADISVLVRNALLEPVRRCQVATHFKRITQNDVAKWCPCPPNDPDPAKKEMSLMEVSPHELAVPDITMGDFSNALIDMKPTVAANELQHYISWTRQFGIEGN